MPLGRRAGQRLRFFTGFSGWAPGQLQRELALEAWLVLPVTEEILFRDDTQPFSEQDETVLRQISPIFAIALSNMVRGADEEQAVHPPDVPQWR